MKRFGSDAEREAYLLEQRSKLIINGSKPAVDPVVQQREEKLLDARSKFVADVVIARLETGEQ